MSDWQVGDLALCVTRDPIKCPQLSGSHQGEWAPAVGSVRKVVAIGPSRAPGFTHCDCVGLSLETEEVGHNLRFVKVTPPAADEFDRETIELMNRVGEPVQ